MMFMILGFMCACAAFFNGFAAAASLQLADNEVAIAVFTLNAVVCFASAVAFFVVSA